MLVCVVYVDIFGTGSETIGAGEGEGGASKLALLRSEFSAVVRAGKDCSSGDRAWISSNVVIGNSGMLDRAFEREGCL